MPIYFVKFEAIGPGRPDYLINSTQDIQQYCCPQDEATASAQAVIATPNLGNHVNFCRETSERKRS